MRGRRRATRQKERRERERGNEEKKDDRRRKKNKNKRGREVKGGGREGRKGRASDLLNVYLKVYYGLAFPYFAFLSKTQTSSKTNSLY